MKKILVFGSYATDLNFRTPKFPIPGESVVGSAFMTTPGGKGSNQAVAAHLAGGEVTLVTKLGQDAFGREAVSFYHTLGLSSSALLYDDRLPTGTSCILVDEKTAQNETLIVPGACANISREEVLSRKGLITGADYLLLQLEINMDAMDEVIAIASRAGVKIILNPAPARPLSPETLKTLYAITPNETEAALLTGLPVETTEDAAAAAEWFLARGVKNAVITLGSRGVYVTDGEKGLHIDSIPVSAVDTIGAGDAFNGAFTTALADGKDLFDACRWANCAAALSVTRQGAAASMPARGEIERLYESTYR